MDFFVGTSGWFYPWNERRTLEWFVDKSGLNAVELNASFYRFPFPNQINSWAKKGRQLHWSIKVNRLITHIFRFDSRAEEAFKRFKKLFSPLDRKTDFYLFQLPPNCTSKYREKISGFAERTELFERFALEPRNKDWFSAETEKWAKKNKISIVSVDAPNLPRTIFNTTTSVYVRMHGRTSWYAHTYSSGELEEVARAIVSAKPKNAYVFFNNDHAMLENAREMRVLLSKYQP